ncbi:MAG: hypothetical protein OXH73_00655 [Caldilineaceae bacterium]|nr:hypothetical protein [Caldilineaceae bacterium]
MRRTGTVVSSDMPSEISGFAGFVKFFWGQFILSMAEGRSVGDAAGVRRRSGKVLQNATEVLHFCFWSPDQREKGRKRAKIGAKKGNDGGAAGLGVRADFGRKVVAELPLLVVSGPWQLCRKGTPYRIGA